MTLPTLTLPKYRIKVPSTKEMVSYRPFIVKEEKVLLIALESEEYSMIASAIKHIVNECTFNKLDIDNLPFFDIGYLFINIRAKSVGETSEPTVNCVHCGCANITEVDLTKIKVKHDKNHTNKISLGGNLGIIMKYPVVSDDKEAENKTVVGIDAIAECVELIYNGEEVHKANDCDIKDIVDFIEGLTHKQFETILQFFDTMPKLSYNIKFKCIKCDKENNILLEALSDFFL